MLHLISETSISPSVIDRIVGGDDVLLQGGAVWSVFAGHRDNPKLLALLARGCQVYALQDLLSASGISEQQLLPGVQVIDYPGFVELTVKNPVIQTWS